MKKTAENFTGALTLTLGGYESAIVSRILPPPQNYLSFPRGKSFLNQMLFHSSYKVSIGFGGAVFS